MKMIDILEEWIKVKVIGNPSIVDNLVYTAIALLILLILRYITVKIVCRRHPNQIRQFAAKKLMSSAYIALGVIVLLVIWNDSSEYIIAVFGVLTAGVAFALRDLLVDMIGWIYILWAAPFKIGDRIQVGENIGDVVDVKMLHFNILEVGNRNTGEQSTGRIIQIPNLQVFSIPMANYEKDFNFIWNELTMTIDQAYDWEKVKEKIYEILEVHIGEIVEEAKAQIQALEKNTAIYFNNVTPIIYTEFKGGKVVLSIRYLCEPRKLRVTEHLLWEAILKMVKEENIKLG